nr:hypothetical protein [Tanacetum cinerariifolium]
MADPVFSNHVPASLDHAPPPPQQDIVTIDAATETTAPEAVALHVLRLRFRSAARHWVWLQPKVQTFRDREDEPRCKIREISSAARVHPVTEDAWADIVELQTRSEDSEAYESTLKLRLSKIESLLSL